MPNLFHEKVTNVGNILHSLCKHVWGKAVSYVRKEETVTTFLHLVLFSFLVWLSVCTMITASNQSDNVGPILYLSVLILL